MLYKFLKVTENRYLFTEIILKNIIQMILKETKFDDVENEK